MARFLGALVLCLAVAVFAVQNDVAVRLVFLGLRAPAVHLAFLILGALILGALVTVLLGGLQVLRMRRRITALEHDLEGLRAAPAGAMAAPAPVDALAEALAAAEAQSTRPEESASAAAADDREPSGAGR